MAKKFLRLTPFLFATAILVGCGGGLGSTTKPDPSSPGTLTPSSSSVDFGQVAVGGNKTTSLTVTNSSSDTSVTISQISLTGSRFSLVSPPSTPLVVAAGQSASLSVKFSPTAGGSATGTLTVASDASDASVDVPLSGTGLASSQLSMSPSTFSFGSVAVGSSKNLSGTLTAGSSSVTVSTADWNGQGFSLSGISFPATIAAGKSISYTVTFTPSAAGSSSGTLSFVSNANNSPANATLSGTGSQSTQHSVSLSWLAGSSNVAGYNVYRGTVSGGPYAKMTSAPQTATTFTDATVQSGTTYYYVATSISSSGAESSFSSQVVATVPSP